MADMAMTDGTQAATKAGAAFSRFRFVLTICAGSFLLFLVQPMVARMALPRLGGAPSVWNSAMLVYQALLLGGYAYAHWLGRFSGRMQARVHIVLFALAALMLPIGLISTTLPADASPIFWVPWLLVTSIGPLFFMVAAQAPLMQRWYSLSGGDNPYPLYAASNLGSFGGLIAYPLVVEPLLPVAQQSLVWSMGYGIVLLLVLGCARQLPKDANTITASQTAVTDTPPLPDRRTVGMWILLAAIPSGLMLSTSLHLTTDIVAMPLLWVLPLGLYLLSFSIAFADNRRLADSLTALAPIYLLMAACGAFADSSDFPFLFAAVTLLNLFVISVALHGTMFGLRPHPAHLTRFYLAMSVGGVIGGIFCALIAPLVFDWTYEHPLLIAAAGLMLVRKPLFDGTARIWDHPTRGAAIIRWTLVAGLFLSLLADGALLTDQPGWIKWACIIVLIVMALIAIGKRVAFAGLLVCLMLSMGGWTKLALSAREGAMTRSYFGNYAIRNNGPNTRVLVHGTTIHGMQSLTPGREREPTSYYAPRSGVGLAMRAAPALFGPKARIGVVGLGAGTMACYAQSGQAWRFYEIDPVIADIARNPRDFTFLSRCLPDVPIAIGDARLVLAREPDNSADVLAIDAFSSDSVPMHLLTREAFATYGRHLAPAGLLMVHVSNRYLDLHPVIAAAAKDGWTVRIRSYMPGPKEQGRNYTGSDWIALSRDPATIARLETLTEKGAWQPLPSRPGFAAWTDDYASILPILKLKNGK